MPICCAAAMESSSRAPFGYRYRWSLVVVQPDSISSAMAVWVETWIISGVRCDHSMYRDRKSTRLNSSHLVISYAVFCLKKKKPNSRYTALDRPVVVPCYFSLTHL